MLTSSEFKSECMVQDQDRTAFSRGKPPWKELVEPNGDRLPFYRFPKYSYLHCAQWLNYPSRAKIHGAPTW